jgi:DNA-binding beta-propeller fold protein YncE
MKRELRRILALLALAVLAPGGRASGQTNSQYYFIRQIPLGGVAGSPSLTIDAEGRRLYITHSTHIDLVNLDTGDPCGVISNVPSPRGLAIVPKLHRGFVSNSREGSVSLLGLTTQAVTANLKAAAGTVSMLYEPGRGEVYAFNTRALSATVLDADSGAIVATIPIPAKPGNAVADSGLDRVYCTLFDRNEVAVLNTKNHTFTGAWPLKPGKEPAGLAVDSENHRLFVGCRNKRLILLDDHSGKVLSSVPIGAGVDATAFDPSTHLVFCSGSDGTTTIARAETPDTLAVIQTLHTEKNARLMALDPLTHKIYLATTDYEAQLDPDPGVPAPRPRTLPDSFKLLVYGAAP